VLWFNSFSKTR